MMIYLIIMILVIFEKITTRLNKDLQQAFPHLMPAPQVKETQRYKFHNPIENN